MIINKQNDSKGFFSVVWNVDYLVPYFLWIFWYGKLNMNFCGLQTLHSEHWNGVQLIIIMAVTEKGKTLHLKTNNDPLFLYFLLVFSSFTLKTNKQMCTRIGDPFYHILSGHLYVRIWHLIHKIKQTNLFILIQIRNEKILQNVEFIFLSKFESRTYTYTFRALI